MQIGLGYRSHCGQQPPWACQHGGWVVKINRRSTLNVLVLGSNPIADKHDHHPQHWKRTNLLLQIHFPFCFVYLNLYTTSDSLPFLLCVFEFVLWAPSLLLIYVTHNTVFDSYLLRQLNPFNYFRILKNPSLTLSLSLSLYTLHFVPLSERPFGGPGWTSIYTGYLDLSVWGQLVSCYFKPRKSLNLDLEAGVFFFFKIIFNN